MPGHPTPLLGRSETRSNAEGGVYLLAGEVVQCTPGPYEKMAGGCARDARWVTMLGRLVRITAVRKRCRYLLC